MVRDMYGPGINATSMLLGAPAGRSRHVFPLSRYSGSDNRELDTLCKSGGSWDTHGNNFNCLKDRLLPEFDRPFAALLDDLHQRGLLEATLVLVSSEMGRKPHRRSAFRRRRRRAGARSLDGACQSILLAWAAVFVAARPMGASDARAPENIAFDNPVAPEHIARTVFHAMGIDNLHAVDREGRPFHLMEDGRPLTELF